MTKKDIRKELQTRVLVMDGAMGSLIQEYKLTQANYHGKRLKDFPHDQKGNNDILSITYPAIICEIHTKYLEAGADILLTNTFFKISISFFLNLKPIMHEVLLAITIFCPQPSRF